MKRRGFLGLVLSGLAGYALDLERLLWVPGQRTYFLPSTTLFLPDWDVRAWWSYPEGSPDNVLRVQAMPGRHADWGLYGSAIRHTHPEIDEMQRYNLALSLVEHAQREAPWVSTAGLEQKILAVVGRAADMAGDGPRVH